MLCRLHLAALHHNPNSDRQQATTGEGERHFIIIKPKYKPGSATAKPIKEPPTYSYAEELMTEVSEYDSEASPHARQPSPPPLSSEHTYPSKEDVIQQHQTQLSSAHE
ncbi:uncharacterized protein [Diadema setosum]|uniref:uncharacterized protein n=1 Tax=Diadema setosum TaxID=31175 RepID=UPI003B3A6A1E